VAEFVDTATLESRPVRPDLTRGVTARQLLDRPVAMTLTRVVPGGNFQTHRDQYGHLFLVLSGRGEVLTEEERHHLGPGQMVRIAPGEMHAYANTGQEDWLLLSLNIPQGG